jgi:RNA polymerase sigma-70 factor (ECF subfamily)
VSEPDDQALWQDVRAGRPGACAELVRSHYQAVYRLLVRLTRDVHQAEDLTQETFAVAWEKIGTFEGRSSLSTWLHRIAYTRFIDFERSRRGSTDLRDRLASQKEATSTADPFVAAVADDEARRLNEALSVLDEPARMLLVLHYLQDLSYREMAAILDEPAGTLKWRVSEALNRLRTVLGNEVSEHAPRSIR